MKPALSLAAAIFLIACGGSEKRPDQTATRPAPVGPSSTEANEPDKAKAPAPQKKAEAKLYQPKLTPKLQAAEQARIGGNIRRALSVFQAGLTAEEAKEMPDWIQLSYLNNQIGKVYSRSLQYSDALKHHQAALAIELKQLGPNHYELAAEYNNVAKAFGALGQSDKALDSRLKALAIWLAHHDPQHALVATCRYEVGLRYDANGDHAKALTHLEKSLPNGLVQLSPSHPDLALAFNNIAFAYKRAKK